MKILMVDLPFLDMKESDYNIGIHYVLGYLEKNEADFELLDFRGTDYYKYHSEGVYFTSEKSYQKYRQQTERVECFHRTLDELIPYIQSFDVIAFSIFFSLNKIHFDEMYEYIRPHILPHQKVVVGGNYLSHYNHHLEFEGLDVDVVVGDGEPYFQKLLGLPDFEPYSHSQLLGKCICRIPILVSRGCINKCVFCTHRKLPIFHRHPKHVCNEIIHFAKRDVIYHYNLRCDNLINDYDIHDKLMDNLCLIQRVVFSKMEKGAMNWSANFSFTDFDTFTKNVDVSKMKKAGCVMLGIGIESYSEEVRRKLGKPRFTNEDVEKFCQVFRDNDILINQYLMTGYITETDDEFERGLEEADRILSKYGDVFHGSNMFTYMINGKQNYQGFEEDFGYDENDHWVWRDNTHEKRMERHARLLEVLNRHTINNGLGADHNGKRYKQTVL